jgi:hypothetical protein
VARSVEHGHLGFRPGGAVAALLGCADRAIGLGEQGEAGTGGCGR